MSCSFYSNLPTRLRDIFWSLVGTHCRAASLSNWCYAGGGHLSYSAGCAPHPVTCLLADRLLMLTRTERQRAKKRETNRMYHERLKQDPQRYAQRIKSITLNRAVKGRHHQPRQEAPPPPDTASTTAYDVAVASSEWQRVQGRHNPHQHSVMLQSPLPSDSECKVDTIPTSTVWFLRNWLLRVTAEGKVETIPNDATATSVCRTRDDTWQHWHPQHKLKEPRAGVTAACQPWLSLAPSVRSAYMWVWNSQDVIKLRHCNNDVSCIAVKA